MTEHCKTGRQDCVNSLYRRAKEAVESNPRDLPSNVEKQLTVHFSCSFIPFGVFLFECSAENQQREPLTQVQGPKTKTEAIPRPFPAGTLFVSFSIYVIITDTTYPPLQPPFLPLK
jgi:hypothetical protein